VFVDDASAISYNPANLGMMTNASVVVGLTLAQTENKLSPAWPSGTLESDGDWNVLPNLYYSQPVGDQGLVVGLGIATPYGQGIAWKASDFAPVVGLIPPQSPVVPYEASVMTLNFNPTVGYKATDSLHIGAGLDIYYSQLELKALLDSGVLPGGTPGTVLDSKGEGDGWAAGGNIGVTWLPVEGQRLTFTFRSRADIDYKGDFEVMGTGAGDFETTIKYPNSFGFGYGIELGEAVQVEALVEWLQWSVNDTQPLVAGGLSQPQVNNWDDTFTLGVGGSWAATDDLMVRAGYAYLPSPIPDATATWLLPDADRHALSVGVGYSTGLHTLDLAYTFSIYGDRKTPKGSYEIDSNLVGVTYSLSF
jgi:long-chain fatty acid transport protein